MPTAMVATPMPAALARAPERPAPGSTNPVETLVFE